MSRLVLRSSSGDSSALQYYTLAFTMILKFVACLGAKNSNVASDRCQVEFDDYCALLHSTFTCLQVFFWFCIPPYSVFCNPLYCGSDNVGLDRCGVEFESSRSKLWELPLVSCGSITFLHTAHKYKIEIQTNTKLTQRVTNTEEAKNNSKVDVKCRDSTLVFGSV